MPGATDTKLLNIVAKELVEAVSKSLNGLYSLTQFHSGRASFGAEQ